jgi:hypothetical protein
MRTADSVEVIIQVHDCQPRSARFTSQISTAACAIISAFTVAARACRETSACTISQPAQVKARTCHIDCVAVVRAHAPCVSKPVCHVQVKSNNTNVRRRVLNRPTGCYPGQPGSHPHTTYNLGMLCMLCLVRVTQHTTLPGSCCSAAGFRGRLFTCRAAFPLPTQVPVYKSKHVQAGRVRL